MENADEYGDSPRSLVLSGNGGEDTDGEGQQRTSGEGYRDFHQGEGGRVGGLS